MSEHQAFHCRGSHGFVQLAVDLKTGNEVAIKFIKRGSNMQAKSILRCEMVMPHEILVRTLLQPSCHRSNVHLMGVCTASRSHRLPGQLQVETVNWS